MTTEPTLADLDRWCATEVMGWTCIPCDDCGVDYAGIGTGIPMHSYHWQPTRNPAQALEVLEKWCEKNDAYYLIEGSAKWESVVQLVRNADGDMTTASADTLSEAICRAVFAAEGGER